MLWMCQLGGIGSGGSEGLFYEMVGVDLFFSITFVLYMVGSPLTFCLSGTFTY